MDNIFYTKFNDENISIVVKSPNIYLVLDYVIGHKKVTRTIRKLSEFDLTGYDLSKPYETTLLIQQLNQKVYGKSFNL